MDERERFAALFGAHFTAILGFAARRCRTPADASDIAADVFVVAWRGIDQIPAGDEARLWLFGVARGILANHRRGELRRDRLGQALLDAWTNSSAADPAELFVVQQEAVTVRAALDQLPPVDADLLTLTAWEGLTSAQAAEVTGLSPDAARARISRARRRLRRLLGRSTGPHPFLTALTTKAQP